MANLKGMNVEALMGLRNQVDKRLLECRAEIEKQLAAFPGPKSNSGKSSLKGKKVPPKYRSPSGETWAGRGARPKWLVAASEEGQEDGEFFDPATMRRRPSNLLVKSMSLEARVGGPRWDIWDPT